MQRSGAMRDSIREEGQQPDAAADPLITTPEDDYGSAASTPGTGTGTGKEIVPSPSKDVAAEDDTGSEIEDLEDEAQPGLLYAYQASKL